MDINPNNVYQINFSFCDLMRAFHWNIIGKRLVLNEWKRMFESQVIQNNKAEQYAFHAFVLKLTSREIVNDTLLLVTTTRIYFVFLDCHKCGKPTSIKHVKWFFPVSNIQSIIFDDVRLINSDFITILFVLIKTDSVKILNESDDEYRALNSKRFKRFAFLDYSQHLKFNVVLQRVYYDLMKTERLRSILNLREHSICDNAMSKMRKLNPNNMTDKWVRFIKLEDGNGGIIEWSDQKSDLAVDRLIVMGISVDAGFLSQALPQELEGRYFALISDERIIAFVAKDEEQTSRWIEFINLPMMKTEDYKFYQYINDPKN